MGTLKADIITNSAGSGAPSLSQGVSITGDLDLSSGQMIDSYSAKSGAYTITDTDNISHFLMTVATSYTLTLPTAADNAGRVIHITKVDSGAGVLTVDGEGAETINGLTTVLLPSQWDSISIIGDGSNWTMFKHDVVVACHYNSNAANTPSGSAVVDFEDKQFDTHSAVTTGASWVFTVPMDGKYIVTIGIQFSNASKTAGQLAGYRIRVDGTEVWRPCLTEWQATGTWYKTMNGCAILDVTKDQTIDIASNHSGSLQLHSEQQTVSVGIAKIRG